jgi:hypothetical protein
MLRRRLDEQGSVIPYTRHLHASLRDFVDCRILCTFSKIPAAAGIARSSQLSSPLPRQTVQYDLAGATARPSSPLYPSPPVSQGRAPCWVGSLCGLRALWRRHHILKGHALWSQRTYAQMYIIVWKLQCIVLCTVLCTACAPGGGRYTVLMAFNPPP